MTHIDTERLAHAARKLLTTRAAARALCMTPTENTRLERDEDTGKWWLLGCVEGDQGLPTTQRCESEDEALSQLERWLEDAP